MFGGFVTNGIKNSILISRKALPITAPTKDNKIGRSVYFGAL
jgi:hypothetical protein